MIRSMLSSLAAPLPLLLLFLLSPPGCTGGRPGADTLQVPDLGPVDPSQARIVGTLTGVDSTLSARAGDPCAQAPCLGSVRIDSVLGYGSSFPAPLSEGGVVAVRFAFTLGPTDGVVEGLSRPLPGLALGDAFVADLRARAVPASGSRQGRITYVVYEYYVKG